jgi:hypothetical protein
MVFSVVLSSTIAHSPEPDAVLQPSAVYLVPLASLRQISQTGVVAVALTAMPMLIMTSATRQSTAIFMDRISRLLSLVVALSTYCSFLVVVVVAPVR